MAAPIKKVSPNLFSASFTGPKEPAYTSLSAFGAVVSSTAPGTFGRASVARNQIRRVAGVK